MNKIFLLPIVLALLVLPAAADDTWAVPEALSGDRVAAALVQADAGTAATALEALRRRPPDDAEGRARHHYLAGVAQRASAEVSPDALADAATSFLRSIAAGPPGGPLHGPALLEAAVTLRLLDDPDAEAAAERLLLEAESFLVRDADAATLARLRAQRS